MDVNTHFWEFKYFNYDKDKPPKVNFPCDKSRTFEFLFYTYEKCILYLECGKNMP